MSGNSEFNPDRLAALVGHTWMSAPMSAEQLSWVVMGIDFKAYAKLGKSITGSTWLRGNSHPEIREVGDGYFEWAVKTMLPWWAKLGGKLLTGVSLAVIVKR